MVLWALHLFCKGSLLESVFWFLLFQFDFLHVKSALTVKRRNMHQYEENKYETVEILQGEANSVLM